METGSESLGEVQFWLDPDDEEKSVVGVFSRVVHRLVPALVCADDEDVEQHLSQLSLEAPEDQVASSTDGQEIDDGFPEVQDDLPVTEETVEPDTSCVNPPAEPEKIHREVPLVPGPFEEPRKKQKKSVRLLNSTGVLVETLRMFEAIKQAGMSDSDSSSDSEGSESGAPSVDQKNGVAESEKNEDDSAPREEKTLKRALEEPQPSGAKKKLRAKGWVLNRVKNFMNLTGFNFDASSSSSELEFGHADVFYLKKNIRAQNSVLKVPQPTVVFEDFEPVEMTTFQMDTVESPALKPKKKPKKNKMMPPEVTAPHMQKYWAKRYQLFSKFDEGIKLDQESWFSVTPERIAEHIAERCKCDVIVDAFCGAGGNAIQFAFTCQRVIAVDIDPEKVKLARHNAAVYGVADRIEFLVADFFQVVHTLKADVVFLSPPWGGPSYLNKKVFNLDDLSGMDGKDLYNKATDISENVVMYLPRNTNTQQLLSLAGAGGYVEMEQSVLKTKIVAITAYFGELVNAA